MIDNATLALPNHEVPPSASARRATVGIAVLALTWAAVPTVFFGLGTTRPLLSLLALVLLGTAVIVVARASDPLRTPFSARAHASVHAMLVAGGFSGAGADWGTDAFARGNWVPVALGLLVVAVSPYRPTRELVGYTAVSGTLLGTAILLSAGPSASPLLALAFALSAVIPTFALALGAAVYSAEIEKAVQDRRARPEGSISALVDELESGVIRSVRRARMAWVGGDVSPFFRQLLGAGRITEHDRERARGIADSLRRTLVDEADRTWLDDLAGLRSGTMLPIRVFDPDRVALQMTRHQRTALRALIGGLGDEAAGIRSSSLTLAGHRVDHREGPDGESRHGVLSLVFDGDPTRARRRLAPYLAAMERAFITLDVDPIRHEVIVRFSYDPN